MAKLEYPESLNCWLKNFPPYIKVTFGPEMENLSGPWGNGSVVLLARIGFSAVDTNPVEGEIPPDVKVTYSDNGSNIGWVFKMGMYGWGNFFATIEGTNYYVLTEKLLEFESTYFTQVKKFLHREVFETQISEITEIPNVDIPVERIDDPPPSDDDGGDGDGGGDDGGGTGQGTVDLDALDHSLLTTNLIQAYWGAWGVNNVYGVEVAKYRAPSSVYGTLEDEGWRQLEGSTFYNNLTVDFWTKWGILLVTFSNSTIICDGFNFEDGYLDCEYSLGITDYFIWTSLRIYTRSSDNNEMYWTEKLTDLMRYI
jgi:hypothetical protein